MGLATEDLKNMRETIKPMEDETLEGLAARLFYMQMEVYSAHAGHDIYKDFDRLDDATRQGWLAAARRKMGSVG